jgi:hypothetical protein
MLWFDPKLSRIDREKPPFKNKKKKPTKAEVNDEEFSRDL